MQTVLLSSSAQTTPQAHARLATHRTAWATDRDSVALWTAELPLRRRTAPSAGIVQSQYNLLSKAGLLGWKSVKSEPSSGILVSRGRRRPGRTSKRLWDVGKGRIGAFLLRIVAAGALEPELAWPSRTLRHPPPPLDEDGCYEPAELRIPGMMISYSSRW